MSLDGPFECLFWACLLYGVAETLTRAHEAMTHGGDEREGGRPQGIEGPHGIEGTGARKPSSSES